MFSFRHRKTVAPINPIAAIDNAAIFGNSRSQVGSPQTSSVSERQILNVKSLFVYARSLIMDYQKVVGMISSEMRSTVSDKLVDIVLASKNAEKMPSRLADAMLRHWQQDLLKSESGVTLLLEAALLLEPEKTSNAFTELQMPNIAEQIGQA